MNQLPVLGNIQNMEKCKKCTCPIFVHFTLFYTFNEILTLSKPMTFSIKFDKVKSGWFIVYIGGCTKKGGKDQESIQSRTKPDPGYHMGK